MKEKISVLIPVYNRENFLDRSIKSISNQIHENLELIIYDDGSTDNSVKIIENYMRYDHRIILLKNNINKGVGYARNQLLKACDTRYAIWQDSDDISNDNRIEIQYEQMKKKEQIIFCTWQNYNNNIDGETRGFATVMFPVDKSIEFDETMMFGGEDFDWLDRMIKKHGSTDLNEVLYYIDFHDNRIGSWKRKICKDWGGMFNKEDINNLTYSEAIKKYKDTQNG